MTYRELESYRVAPATHAEEAIAQAIALQPNLILMDVKMPGIDGLEATRRLKADPRTRHIPVVMLTAFAAATDVEDCLAAGADGFLAKPVDFAKLDAATAQFAARRPA
ncbi:MAG: response regulator [Opitutales bacterium]|nr:response regulator [Opitutales bacterium]